VKERTKGLIFIFYIMTFSFLYILIISSFHEKTTPDFASQRESSSLSTRVVSAHSSSSSQRAHV